MFQTFSQNTLLFSCGILISTLRVEISTPQGKGMVMFDCHVVLRLQVKWPALMACEMADRVFFFRGLVAM